MHPRAQRRRQPAALRDRREEQYRIQSAIEDAGLDLGAIYHSHTRSAPLPSQTDINLAFYPDALYVIVGVAKATRPTCARGDRRRRRSSEAALEVEEG